MVAFLPLQYQSLRDGMNSAAISGILRGPDKAVVADSGDISSCWRRSRLPPWSIHEKDRLVVQQLCHQRHLIIRMHYKKDYSPQADRALAPIDRAPRRRRTPLAHIRMNIRKHR